MLYKLGNKTVYDKHIKDSNRLGLPALMTGEVFLSHLDALAATEGDMDIEVYGIDCSISDTYTFDKKSFFLKRFARLIPLK